MDDTRRRSRFMIRALEWDDARARYPNLWKDGMPRHLLAYDTVAGRLRLGDLLAVYSPSSARHPERSERFVGLSRVVGLRREDRGAAWVDLETAHRFGPPLDLGEAPRRVFLCCDPGWPAADAALFQKVFDAAVAAGWSPEPEDRGEVPARPAREHEEPDHEDRPVRAAAPPPPPAPVHAPVRPEPVAGRRFAGADYSGDMRDPREGTWLAVVQLEGDRLRAVRLDPVGRHGLQAVLTDADAALAGVEAVGLDFPFGLPVPFAEALLGGPFEGDWWALARRMERMSRPEFLSAIQEYRDAHEHDEPKRLTDERSGAFSPLHRVNPDLGPMTFHGIRMIAEERSRFAIRPFERAQGRLLLEVYPGGMLRKLGLANGPAGEERLPAIMEGMAALPEWPLVVEEPLRGKCLRRRDALDAVLAARAAAVAVLGGEADRSPDELAPGAAERIRREGWIYGL